MKIPFKLAYHGTFWPEGMEIDTRGLRTEYGYVSITPDRRWARFFAMSKRYKYREQPGKLVIYEVNIERLPDDVVNNCIPPDGINPEALEDDTLLDIETGMVDDRKKVNDWRLPYVPWDSIINKEEEQRDAEPNLNAFELCLCMPR